uniref:chymotrypsin-like protease CTRL-1 n=1 Tax=Doryrhamphus excisus TaxID=161450 RepID=UPI0025AE22E3|nr:chymotrypsin-like protease CTRL-1 [Doryrhamphus excisus]
MIPWTVWALFLGTLLTRQGTAAQNCGVAPLNTRIAGGEDAQEGSWPWQVYLAVNGQFTCGGMLISNEWVLTAAHCINTVSLPLWTLYLGRHNQSGPNPNEVSRNLSQIIQHPDYASLTRENDVALMKLSTPVNYTNYIQPICIASNSSQIRNGTMCWATGWGQLTNLSGTPKTLQGIEVPIIENNQCSSYFPSGAHTFNNNIICAGLRDNGACMGDSGGPLQCKQDSRWIQVGITGFGMPCTTGTAPEAYTRVSFFQKWIREQVPGANIGVVWSNSSDPRHDSYTCGALSITQSTLASFSWLSILLLLQGFQAV